MQTARHFLLLCKFCQYQHSVSLWIADSDKTLFKFHIERLQLSSQQLNGVSRSGVLEVTLTSFHQCFITYTVAENSRYFDSLTNALSAAKLLGLFEKQSVNKCCNDSHALDAISFLQKHTVGCKITVNTSENAFICNLYNFLLLRYLNNKESWKYPWISQWCSIQSKTSVKSDDNVIHICYLRIILRCYIIYKYFLFLNI